MYEHQFLANIYRFELTDFGLILGMNWLGKYQAQIDCPKQRITLRGPNGEKVVHKGKVSRLGVKLITVIQACKLLGKGCKGLLCNIMETGTVESSLKDIPVVREFPNVFSEEIPSMPPLREVEFYINLIPRATPISKAPYRMA